MINFKKFYNILKVIKLNKFVLKINNLNKINYAKKFTNVVIVINNLLNHVL
jgi:hypothetical protein